MSVCMCVLIYINYIYIYILCTYGGGSEIRGTLLGSFSEGNRVFEDLYWGSPIVGNPHKTYVYIYIYICLAIHLLMFVHLFYTCLCGYFQCVSVCMPR